jgi:hypothetical protein
VFEELELGGIRAGRAIVGRNTVSQGTRPPCSLVPSTPSKIESIAPYGFPPPSSTVFCSLPAGIEPTRLDIRIFGINFLPRNLAIRPSPHLRPPHRLYPMGSAHPPLTPFPLRTNVEPTRFDIWILGITPPPLRDLVRHPAYTFNYYVDFI